MGARRLVASLIALLLRGGVRRHAASPSIAVGARDDAESMLLANLYASALRTYGTAAHVEVVPDPLAGLDSGDVAVAPGFTGRLLDTFAPGAKARAAVQVYRDMVSALPEGVAAGDYAESAEDKPALAVTEATVDAWGGRDVTAAVRHCDQLELGQVVGVTTTGRRSATCAAKVREFPTPQRFSRRCGRVRSMRPGRRRPIRTFPPTWWCSADRTALIRARERRAAVSPQRVVRDAGARAQRGGRRAGHRGARCRCAVRSPAGADPRTGRRRAWLAEHPLGATSR